jgi:hypothetical protein
MQGNGEHHANDMRRAPQGFASPFDRAAWFDLLAAHGFAGQGRYDARGHSRQSTTAWLPLRIEKPGHLAGLTNWYSFSIRPLYTGERRPATRLRAFSQSRAKAARLSLYPVRDDERQRIGRASRRRLVGKNAARATATGSTSAIWTMTRWWASRPGALRNTVQRKAKKGIVDIQLLTAFDPGSWAAYEQIYAASWKPEEGHPALLRAFAEAEGAGGRLRMGIARIDGVPVAAQYWTVEDGTAFIHKLAHVEDSLKASPGTLLSAALFRHVIEVDGVKRVDFGTGNDGYKRDWMNRHEPLWRIEAFNPSRVAAWGPALKAFARSALRKEN